MQPCLQAMSSWLPRHPNTRWRARLGDRDHRRMLQPALAGDGIEALGERLEAADRHDPVLAANFPLDGRGGREEAHPRLAERHQQRTVLELAHHPGTDALALEPVVERP